MPSRLEDRDGVCARGDPPSSPYRRANSRFSIGLSFLKKAASTLTRLISRLTAISSRSMSWPKTSTRPLSRVSSPLIRRMRVDLPEPFAPRIPWMSPRSRRIDTSTIASTGLRLRPTTNDLLTPSMRRAGTAATPRPKRPERCGWWSSSVVREDGGHCRGLLVRGRWWTEESRGPRSDASSGGPRGSGMRPLGLAAGGLAGHGREGIKKAGGPIWPTARGSSGRRS